jgi:GT2 family glycosyltransferase
MTTVSVHIVTYNSGDYIENCLKAVFQQTYPIEQIIIIDNASSDQTSDKLQPFMDRIHVVYNRTNKGFARGHNQAMDISKSKFHLVLNPDVTLHNQYIEKIMNFLVQNPVVGSATGQLLLESNPSIIDSTGLIINKQRRAFDRGANESAIQWSESSYIFGVSGAAAMYSSDMVQDISIYGEFFDADFFAYKEDVDVAWRAQLLGWKSYFVADATAIHTRGWKVGTRKKQPLFLRKLSYINRYKMMLKNESLEYILRHFFSIAFFEIASFGYLILREPNVFPVWLDFIKEIPNLLKKRKQIKKNREIHYKECYSHFVD